MSDQRISVAVRIRPPIERERYEPVCARKADDDQTIIIKSDETSSSVGGTSAFQFDYVFDETDDQLAVYEESVQEMVDHALSGFNATVFTYGQTGSGKTFTILGQMSPDGKVNDVSGMFLRVFDDLFTYKESVKDRIHILITLSAMELYVEDVMDLLSNKKKLKLRETPEETLTMGISVVEVHTMADVVRNFHIANSFRSVTATKMNDTSSRSHALFFIDLFQVPAEKSPQSPVLSQLVDANGSPTTQGCPGIIRSRIALVDLAGSERVKRSGVTGQAMVEAQAINKSLSTLGTVINAMYTQSPHIPFRESKLTKLLKPCFVETTSRLLLIGQVAPPSNSASESLGTLRFCDRVKGLKAGQVMGFTSPEAEEAYLKSCRLNEELLAEMHILRAQYYYEPANLLGLAAAHGVPLEQEKQRVAAELQAGAADVVARKEQEALLKAEEAANAERDTEVEKFVLHMNGLIEEYEQVARSVKKEKKAQKKVHEEQEAEHEARLHEAKKAKKHRLKMEEAMAAAQLQLQTMDEEAQGLDIQIEMAQKDVAAASLRDDDVGTSNAAVDSAVEEATHRLVESFYNHATEQSRLYSLYVSRLGATGRERSQVRRMKLMSSTLVTEGTLLYDLIAFLVDRAVDTAEGDVTHGAKWGWHDVDGLSQRMLCADEMYPPLLPSEFEPLDADAQPCAEEAHDITFLSSDESDDEHSHHAAESRRIRQIRDAAVAATTNGTVTSNKKQEDNGNAAADSSGSADESPAAAPPAHSSDWLNDGIVGRTPPALQGLEAGAVPATATTRPRHHKKGADGAEASKRGRKSQRNSSSITVAAAPPALPVADTADATSVGEEETEEGESVSESSGTESTSSDDLSADSDDEQAAERQKARNAAPKKKKAHQKKSEKRKKEAEAAGATVPPVDAPNPSYQASDARALMKVYDSPTLVHDLIRFLRGGSRMMKHCRRGKPHQRIFWVSTQRGKKELFWKAPDSRSADHACIHLADVSYIQLGCFSKVFHRHRILPSEPAFFRAFTIGLRHGGRTVDIVAETLPDYEAWVVGLAHLVGVDPVWGGKIDLTKEMGTDRLTYFESGCCEANYIRPLQYLELKKRVQHVATRTMQVLSECGNDAAKAQAILGGIHLPAVNEKGAVYMTKGELRFLMSDTFDIFRISRLWMLFQQINLVYDDAFTPATAFGITQREG
ncbi:putative kinesin [Leptomonas pyrrhocoris]|uniref:Putative kinesin n=1 Tax=Leptomonas pyrrhocoris TaxID=157538 RepID=A0A0M9G6D2_LEPPY|nr:putative kinesin [Leptomonas pyrrhocoris]KPA83166.1 putative kinesin [Leptomonas pyrrhocoris]|eukprot:XP_015661605.1 putative kinesin [Leptomonas pyrrhocoris]